MPDKFFNVFLITFVILILAYITVSQFSNNAFWIWLHFVLLPLLYLLAIEIISALFLGWNVIDDRETEFAVFVGMVVSVLSVLVYKGVVLLLA